jgi:ferredoxin
MHSPNSIIAHLVIGSGPTGYATALSLLDQGKEVSVLDPNRTLFPSSNGEKKVSAQKSVFNSHEMYAVSSLSKLEGAIWGIPYSEVRGGLSTTWGAGLQVYPNKYFKNSPCKGVGMQSAYQRILSEIDHIQIDDLIETKFPWPATARSTAPPESKLGNLGNQKNGKIQKLQNILVGHARLAIDARGPRKCRLCSGCLEGCPYDSIFNSGNELLRIAEKNTRLQLINGFAIKINLPSIKNPNFEIEIVNSLGEISTLKAMRVYLSLGAIGTPALLLRSEIIKDLVRIRDSQVFYTASFSLKKVNQPNGISLAQLFVVNKSHIKDEFHLSLYSPNPEIGFRIEKRLCEIMGFKVRIPRFIVNRIVAGIGFIEPKYSGVIELEEISKEIVITKKKNNVTRMKIFETAKIIRKDLRKIGLIHLPYSTQIPEVGSGFHSGGGLFKFPSADSTLLDEYGRLRSNENLLVTDASSMNFNIAGPHTLTAMAFAYRNAAVK